MDLLLAPFPRLFYWLFLASDDGAGLHKYRISETGFDAWWIAGLMLVPLSPFTVAALAALEITPLLAPYGVDGPTVFLWAYIGPIALLLGGALVRGVLYRARTLPFLAMGDPTAELLVRPAWAGRTWTWTLVVVRYDLYGSRRHSAAVLARGTHAGMVALLGATDRRGAGMEAKPA
jgi:hypothetical protein